MNFTGVKVFSATKARPTPVAWRRRDGVTLCSRRDAKVQRESFSGFKWINEGRTEFREDELVIEAPKGSDFFCTAV